jgi:hypothetical protein
MQKEQERKEQEDYLTKLKRMMHELPTDAPFPWTAGTARKSYVNSGQLSREQRKKRKHKRIQARRMRKYNKMKAA